MSKKKVLFQAIQFSQTLLIQKIQFSICIVFVHTQLNVKKFLFQTIQFSISRQFSSIWPIYRAPSGAPTLGLSGPGNNDNKDVHCYRQSFCNTGTSPGDCLLSYQKTRWWVVWPLYRGTVGVFYIPTQPGKIILNERRAPSLPYQVALTSLSLFSLTQSAWAAEYTNCFSAEG